MTKNRQVRKASVECGVDSEVAEDVAAAFEEVDASETAEVKDAGVAGMQDAREEYREFRSIDRDAEDRHVMDYAQTRSISSLADLLRLREQTLRYMARRYAWLDNEDDMYSEFKRVWLQCIKKYDGRARRRHARDRKTGKLIFLQDGRPKMVIHRTPFNTYFFTSMRNRVGNLIKRRHAKRLTDGNGRPVVETMRSLDYPIGDDGDMTLKDVLPDEHSSPPALLAEYEEACAMLGVHDDPEIKRVVERYIENASMESLSHAAEIRIGTIRVSRMDHTVLALGVPDECGDQTPYAVRRKAFAYLGRMISSSGTYKKFEVVSYSLNHNSVNFVIKVRDKVLANKVEVAIARCRAIMAERMSVESEDEFEGVA